MGFLCIPPEADPRWQLPHLQLQQGDCGTDWCGAYRSRFCAARIEVIAFYLYDWLVDRHASATQCERSRDTCHSAAIGLEQDDRRVRPPSKKAASRMPSASCQWTHPWSWL